LFQGSALAEVAMGASVVAASATTAVIELNVRLMVMFFVPYRVFSGAGASPAMGSIKQDPR
jgi:hypothetical protein